MRRRTFFSGLAAGAAVGLAGCGALESSVDADPGVADIDEEYSPPTMGDGDITVVLFQNYACIVCRDYKQETQPQLVDEYVDTGDITYVNRHIPGPSPEAVDPAEDEVQHEQLSSSWLATQAAHAVQQAYDDAAFWEFSTNLYEHAEEDEFDEGFLTYDIPIIEDALEATSDVEDPDMIVGDVEDGVFEDAVGGEQAFAEEIADDVDVLATPSVVVDGDYISGNDYDAIASAIEGDDGLLPF